MPRVARAVYDDGVGGWYHLYARVAGSPDWFPFADELCRHKWLELLRFYSHAYFVDVAAFALMGNHFHIVARFEEPRDLSEAEWFERALRFYPNSRQEIQTWDAETWARFQKRVFSVSEFMRNLQGSFATWFNRTFERRGRLWAERFKSTLLAGEHAVLDCMLYVDLNGVRAGLTQRPEDFKGASIYLREIDEADWLLPLSAVIEPLPRERQAGTQSAQAKRGLKRWLRLNRHDPELAHYKATLYYRGAVPTREGQASIPVTVIDHEERHGFSRRGVYRKKLRYFTDCWVIGSKLSIQDKLDKLRKSGFYHRRKHPIPEPNGPMFRLRHARG